MAKKKKKMSKTKRFGARYGREVKVSLEKIEEKQKKSYLCPSCKKGLLKRVSAGIWQCQKCGSKIAGGAYSPTTEAIVE